MASRVVLFFTNLEKKISFGQGSNGLAARKWAFIPVPHAKMQSFMNFQGPTMKEQEPWIILGKG